MGIEDKTLRELSDKAAKNAQAERADPNDAVRQQIAKDTTARIMDGLRGQLRVHPSRGRRRH